MMRSTAVSCLLVASLAVVAAADGDSAGTISPPNVLLTGVAASGESNATNPVAVASNRTTLAAVKSEASEPTCSTQEGVDFVGNDLSSVLGTVGDCCTKCQATRGCNAFTWSDFNGGTCWLKTARGETKLAAGVYSAEVAGAADVVDDSKWKVEPGVDYIGNDLGSVSGKTVANCQTSCEANAGCRGFTWTDFNGGTCWLKTTRGATKLVEGVTSAIRTFPDAAPGQCNAEQGKDYVGKDLGSAAAADASLCCKQCSVKAGCEAYTWTNWEGGRCWFKADVTGAKENANAVSGKVVSGSSSEHIQYKIRSGAIPSRSVNLGGWLVSEHWMSKTSPAWANVPEGIAGTGEYGVMKYLGKDQGTKQFEEHRATWITEADIQEIASVGLNMVRVPVGFWIVDEISNVQPTDISSVYARGSLKYLDKLINEWAVKYNVAVYLSLHSHQGSQNGFDHSAPQELFKSEWSNWQNNVDNSVRFASLLAARYKDAPAFVGLQLMNEPAGSTSYEVRDAYYLRAYKEVRANGNDCIVGISPMLFQQDQWMLRDFMRWPEYTNVWMEWHTYYKWNYENKSEDEIIAAVKTYHKDHFDNWPGNWVHIGEWSLGNGWNEEKFKDVNKLREFAQAQMEQFQAAHAGWSFWSWHHDDEYLKQDNRPVVSGWNLRQLLRLGIFTIPK